MLRLTLRQLEVFEAVAHHLSYSRASEMLHLTQPAVSIQIKQLEEAVGIPLFEQLGKKIYITEAGEELRRYSRNIVQQLAEAETVFEEMKGMRRGKLAISVPQRDSCRQGVGACGLWVAGRRAYRQGFWCTPDASPTVRAEGEQCNHAQCKHRSDAAHSQAGTL